MKPRGTDRPIFDIRDGQNAIVEWLLGQWIFKASMAITLVQRNGQVVWRNLAAEELANQRTALTFLDGILTGRARATALSLHRVLGAVGAEPILHVALGEPTYRNVAIQLLSVSTVLGDVIGCWMRSCGPRSRINVASLSKAFLLTSAEVVVIHKLMEGVRADDIAQMQAISLETVRTHVRNVYKKLNISNREELFSICLPYIFLDGSPGIADAKPNANGRPEAAPTESLPGPHG